MRDAPARSTAAICCSIVVLGCAARIPGFACTRAGSPNQFVDTILLEPGEGVPFALIDAAVALWAVCPDYGRDFPRFLRRSGGESYPTSPVIQIVLGGCNDESDVCGVFQGRRIVLYSEATSKFGTPMRCGVQAANLAHELGHVLGLNHADRGPRDRMMGSVPRFGRLARAVSVDDCEAAGFRWLTNVEVAQQRRDPVE